MRHLSAFVEVARRGSVTKAARVLHLSQSAISHSLAELEEILNAPLLNRERGGVSLAPLGEIFFRYAEQILAIAHEGQEAVAVARECGGFKINFGVLPNMAARIVPMAIHNFMRENPSAMLHASSGSNLHLLTLLKTGELEFVVGRMSLPKEMEGVSFEHLHSERVALVVRPEHPLLKAWRGKQPDNKKILNEVGNYLFIHMPPYSSAREDTDQFFIQNGVPLPSWRVDTDSVALARRMALEGDAVWCFPLAGVEDDLRGNILKELPVNMSETTRPVGISIRAGSRPSPQCAALMNKIRQYAGEIQKKKAKK